MRCIDRTRKSVHVEPRGFRGTRPSVELFANATGRCLSGSINRFFSDLRRTSPPSTKKKNSHHESRFQRRWTCFHSLLISYSAISSVVNGPNTIVYLGTDQPLRERPTVDGSEYTGVVSTKGTRCRLVVERCLPGLDTAQSTLFDEVPSPGSCTPCYTDSLADPLASNRNERRESHRWG